MLIPPFFSLSPPKPCSLRESFGSLEEFGPKEAFQEQIRADCRNSCGNLLRKEMQRANTESSNDFPTPLFLQVLLLFSSSERKELKEMKVYFQNQQNNTLKALRKKRKRNYAFQKQKDYQCLYPSTAQENYHYKWLEFPEKSGPSPDATREEGPRT